MSRNQGTYGNFRSFWPVSGKKKKKGYCDFHLTILTFFFSIADINLTIASYKVRITIYKVTIAR